MSAITHAGRRRSTAAVVSGTTLSLAVITGFGALIRFATLGQQSFWIDEGWTYQLLHRSFGAMLSTIPHTERTPYLYYVLAWPWAHIFGFSEAGIRSFSALFGTLTILVVYIVGRELRDSMAGLIAAAIAATNPLLVWYSQEARAYSLLAFLTSVQLVFFCRLLRGESRRSVWGWGIVSVLAIGTHYFAAFVVIPEAGVLLWRHRRSRPIRVALGAVALALLISVPLAIEQRSDSGSGIDGGALPRRIAQVPKQFLVGFDAWHEGLLALVAAACLGIALFGFARIRRRTPGLAVVAGVAVVSLLIPIVLAAGGQDYIDTRNVIGTLVPCIVVAAVGFSASRFTRIAAGVFVAVSVMAVASVVLDSAFQRTDWRGAARAVGTGGVPRAVAVAPYDANGGRPLDIYLGKLTQYGSSRSVREVAVIAMGAKANDLTGTLHAAQVQVERGLLPAFRVARRTENDRYTVVVLRAAAPTAVSARKIASAIRFPTSKTALLFQP
jgi:mannosyltransferase